MSILSIRNTYYAVPPMWTHPPGVKDAPISLNVQDASVHCASIFCRRSIIIIENKQLWTLTKKKSIIPATVYMVMSNYVFLMNDKLLCDANIAKIWLFRR